MGVTCGFQAFKDTESGSIDYIYDSEKVFTANILGTVPSSLEAISKYSDPDESVHRYHEYFQQMQSYGFSEKDLDFLIYINNSAYSGEICNSYFEAEDCYNKFIKFTNHFKNEESPKDYSRLLDLDTNRYVNGQVAVNGHRQAYQDYQRGDFQENLARISTVVWNVELNRWEADKPLNCKIVDLTLYEYCKETIDAIADFFLKHAKEKNLIQGHWD